jgi:putative hydrolase of the HAD superfamily
MATVDPVNKQQATPPRAILFDLDGTLDDRSLSVARYAEPFRSAFAEHLAELEIAALAAALQRADGDGYRLREAVCQELLQALPWRSLPEATRLVEHWYEWFPLSTAPREGLMEVLQALVARGIKLGVVTNGGVRIQQAKLKALGVEPYLSAVVISEAAGVAKPDPAIFLHALAQLVCEPGEAWFVGDHPVNDLLGASAAGLRGIWLPALHPWPPGQPEPWRTITALPELLALIEDRAGDPSTSGPAGARL